MINILLWFLGVVALVVGILNVRGPFARMSEIDRLAENAKRYDSWRGGSRTAAGESGTTGADILRGMLRRQVLVWSILGVIGVVLIIAGFAIR